MKLRGLGRLKQAVHRVQKRLAPKGLVLMYHRVAEADLDPWNLCVTPARFAEHLNVLRKYTRPTSLQELVEAHRQGRMPHRAVALTFDDGYVDNLYTAKPLLKQYNIPATVFITTGYSEQNREFWWDELEQLLLKPGQLPKKLCLTIGGEVRQWELGEANDYSESDYQNDRSQKAEAPQISPRLALYYSVWQQLQPLSAEEQRKAIDEIKIWADVELVVRPTHRSLSPDEVLVLADGDLVEIGAHTITHPFLSAHSVEFQRFEIQQSKSQLEEILDRPVTSFSYPFGVYTPETVSLVQEIGFNCTCSTFEDVVWRQSNRFQLPRFQVENWTGEEFAQRLQEWLDD